MWRYSDYLSINQDFIDVFTAEEDRKHTDAWKGFIPHQAMRQVLTGLVRSLERTTPKPLWIHGPYGTGKTYCQFALKHILEDPWPDVEDYFRAHRLGADLLKRLQSIRKQGPGLVVYLSGSAYVTSNLKFYAALERGISAALTRQGMDPAVDGPMYEAVLSRIEGPEAPIDWPRLFSRNRGDFLGLASTPEEVLTILRSDTAKDEQRFDLLGHVVTVLEKAGVVVLDSPARMKAWLKAVIRRNGLTYLLVMWDEFTEFFLGGAGLDGLQELAQLCAEAPFYLMLTTHRAPDLVRVTKSEEWSKVRDRFARHSYNMAPMTAYHLMGHVFRVRPGRETEWDDKRTALSSRVSQATRWVLRDETNAKKRDLTDLAPIHPYSAYLLATISQQFTASQRTLFGFMKGDGEDGFPRFLREFPREDWQWFTADGLWDYFFLGDNPDFPADFREVVSYYRSRSDEVQGEEEARTYKAIMLLIALERTVAGDKRTAATMSNLRAMFAGTPLQRRLKEVVKDLAEHGLVRQIGGRTGTDVNFIIPRGNIDQRRVKEIKAQQRSFRDQMSERGDIGRKLKSSVAQGKSILGRRQSVTVCSADEIAHRRDRVNPICEPYELGVVWVVALGETDHQKADAVIRDLASQAKNAGVVYALLSKPFGQDRFDDYLDDSSLAVYHREIQANKDAQFHATRANDAVTDWLRGIRNADIDVAFDGSVSRVNAIAGFCNLLGDLVAQRFPYRPERITPTQTVFRDSYGVAGAQTGLGTKSSSQPYSQVVPYLKSDNLWPQHGPLDADELAQRAEHPLSRMKAAVDEAFQQDAVDLGDLWETLQAPPYGLMPSPIGILLMGLVLRDYVEGYYYRDGTNSLPLDPTKLAGFLNDIMHNRGTVTLQRTSQEARDFCALMQDLFGLERDRARYPENAREAVRTRLRQVGYPLWALNCYLEGSGRARSQTIDDLHACLASTDSEDVALSQERLRTLVGQLRTEHDTLRSLIGEGTYQQGMRWLLGVEAPDLVVIADGLGISIEGIMARLRHRLQEEVWLWRRDEVVTRLPVLQDQLRLVVAINALTGFTDQDLTLALQHFCDELHPGKLPPFVLAAGSETVKDAISSLGLLCEQREAYVTKGDLADALERSTLTIRETLQSPVKALREWIASQMDVALDEEQAREIWEALPDLSEVEREDEVRRAVNDRLRSLKKRCLCADLAECWLNLTGSASPAAWSREHRVPVSWVLDGPRHGWLVQAVNRPEGCTEQVLENALATLQREGDQIGANLADDPANTALVRIAAGAYQGLLDGDGSVQALKEVLVDACGERVTDWHRSDVQRATQDWLAQQYAADIKPRVIDTIRRIPRMRLRKILESLADDPLIGARIRDMERE